MQSATAAQSQATQSICATSVDLHSNEKPNDHLRQKAALELQYADTESTTHIGPAPR